MLCSGRRVDVNRRVRLPQQVKHTAWDLRQAGQIKKEQVRAISMLHEGFARTLTHSLGAYLRVIFEANVVSVEQLTFREFLSRIPDFAYSASFTVNPMGVTGVMVLDLHSPFRSSICCWAAMDRRIRNRAR